MEKRQHPCALLAWDSQCTQNERHAARLTSHSLTLYLSVIERWLRATRFVFKGLSFSSCMEYSHSISWYMGDQDPISLRNESNPRGSPESLRGYHYPLRTKLPWQGQPRRVQSKDYDILHCRKALIHSTNNEDTRGVDEAQKQPQDQHPAHRTHCPASGEPRRTS